VIESLGRRLRIVMGLPVVEPPGEAAVVAPPLPPEVEFIAYAEDCLLRGHIRMDAARLSDLLNDHDEYQLDDVQVEAVVGERVIEIKDVVVRRDELLVVHALGPRGERTRRIRTRQHPLAMQVGPYHVRGHLHALPGSDPVASFRRRKPMVPLTDAWIEYEQGGTRERRRVTTLVVNRQQVEWLAEARDDEVEMPDLLPNVPGGPLVKDFTDQVLGRVRDRRR
jgi:hypothetical protein